MHRHPKYKTEVSADSDADLNTVIICLLRWLLPFLATLFLPIYGLDIILKQFADFLCSYG